VAGLLLYALGFRGWKLFCGVLIAWLPIDVIAMGVITYMFPPKIEIYYPRKYALRIGKDPDS
jgi:hypothetical protein